MVVDSTLFLAVSCGIEACFVMKILCMIVQRGPCGRRSLSSMKCCCSWPMALLKCLRAQFAEPSPEKKLVNDAVAALQIVMGHRFLHAYAFLSLSSLLSIQYNILLGRARWMFAATTWTNVVVFGCLTLYVIFPKSLRKSTLNIFYVCGMALAAAYLSPWHTPADQLLDFALIMFVFFRLPAVILCTKTSLVFLCNMAFVVITAYRATHEEMATEGAFGSSYFVLWMELSTCVIALACHIGFQSTLQRKAELKLRGGIFIEIWVYRGSGSNPCLSPSFHIHLISYPFNEKITWKRILKMVSLLALFVHFKCIFSIGFVFSARCWCGEAIRCCIDSARPLLWCSCRTGFGLLSSQPFESFGGFASKIEQPRR